MNNRYLTMFKKPPIQWRWFAHSGAIPSVSRGTCAPPVALTSVKGSGTRSVAFDGVGVYLHVYMHILICGLTLW